MDYNQQRPLAMNHLDHYLSPESVSQLKNIEMRARLVVEGFITGLHSSPYHGFSVEFAEHRPYNLGDTIRHIDWRVFARTDKYYIKEFEEETNLKGYIMLDISNSMRYTSGGITKLEYAKTLAAALSYLMIKQRDAAGLAAFDDQLRQYILPKSKISHLQSLLITLENLQPSFTTNISIALQQMAEKIQRRGLIILISDLFDEPGKILQALKHFRYRKHEVIVFHILDPKEISLDFKQDIEFIDLETNEKIVTQPFHIRKAYTQLLKDQIEFYRLQCQQDFIDYQLFTTDTPYDKTLLYYLEKRRKLG